MGALGYMYNDQIDDLTAGATTLAITNEDSDFPVENLQSSIAAEVCLTTNKTSIKLNFDYGSTKSTLYYAFINHNFSGGTLQVYSYTANDFSTGQVDEGSYTVPTGGSGKDFFKSVAAQSGAKRYWQMDLSAVTSADSYFKIGRFMCYDSYGSFTEAEDYDADWERVYENILNASRYGVIHSYKIKPGLWRITYRWKVRKSTNMPADVTALFDLVNGRADPFLLIPDVAETTAYYVRMADDNFSYRDYEGDYTEGLSFAVVEESRGKTI